MTSAQHADAILARLQAGTMPCDGAWPPGQFRWCSYVRAEVDGRYNRDRLVDDRIRDILTAGESVVRDNADGLTSCLVMASEDPS